MKENKNKIDQSEIEEDEAFLKELSEKYRINLAK